MIRIESSDEEIEALQQAKRSHPDPQVRRRMEALQLKALGYPHQQIGTIVGVSQKTLRDYLRRYQSGGLEGLQQRDYHPPHRALAPHRGRLIEEFAARPAQTKKEAADRVERLTQMRRSPDPVRRYLTKLGLKRLKTGQGPAKGEPHTQADFLKKIRTPARQSPTRPTVALLCRGSSFCPAPLWRLFVVVCPGLYQSVPRSPTFQCLGRIGGGQLSLSKLVTNGAFSLEVLCYDLHGELLGLGWVDHEPKQPAYFLCNGKYCDSQGQAEWLYRKARMRVQRRGQPVELTPTEFRRRVAIGAVYNESWVESIHRI